MAAGMSREQCHQAAFYQAGQASTCKLAQFQRTRDLLFLLVHAHRLAMLFSHPTSDRSCRSQSTVA